MGFLSDIKLKRELKKLEAQREKSPTADVFKRLAEIYADNESDLQKAVSTADEGRRMFPDDPGVNEVYDRFHKVQVKKEIVSIEKKLLNFPSASLFVKLCEKYYQVGDYDKAANYAGTCIREYPDKSAAYIVMGRISRSRGELEEAVGMYDKACMLDRYNYDALMEYGEVLEQAGDPSKALSIYKAVLFFAPADAAATAKIESLRQTVEDAPAAPSPDTEMIAKGEETPFNIDFDDKAAAPPTTADVPKAVDAPAGAEPAPTQAETPPPADTAPAVADTPPPADTAAPAADATPAPAEKKADKPLIEQLNALLRELRDIDGVEGSILIDNYGLSIAEDIEGQFDSDLLAAVLTNMLRTIKQHAGPADFGDFMDGFVETDTSNFHLYTIKDVELVIFSNQNTRLGLLEMKVKSLVEKFLEIEAEL